MKRRGEHLSVHFCKRFKKERDQLMNYPQGASPLAANEEPDLRVLFATLSSEENKEIVKQEEKVRESKQ